MKTIYRPRNIVAVERGMQGIIARVMEVSRPYVCQSLRRRRNSKMSEEIRRFALAYMGGWEEIIYSSRH